MATSKEAAAAEPSFESVTPEADLDLQGHGIPTYYANVGNISATLFDVVMVWGTRDEKGHITESHKLFISKEQAWTFAKILDRVLVTNFANHGGMVPISPRMIEELDLQAEFDTDKKRIAAEQKRRENGPSDK